MKNQTKTLLAGLAVTISLGVGGLSAAYAKNPIVQTRFTADPAPYVHNDTVFLYTTHDDDLAEGFLMKEWLLYTSTDMVNWTDHGVVADLSDFVWSQSNGAWAHQVVERDGKFYMYAAVAKQGGYMSIGVLASDSPYGPFSDPLGHPLIENNTLEDIDPTVWIDDDGQAYLYWGNPNIYYVKLNRDMLSYDGDVVKCGVIPEDYQEGPWFYKRNGIYYLAYASTCCPEGMSYAMSSSPVGPWRRKGTIMDHNPKSNGNHPGIIEYKGKDYVFGFSYDLHKAQSDAHCERRSVSLAEFRYNPDGTIPELRFWDEQEVNQIEPLNPFRKTEAETIAWSEGVTTARDSETGIYVTDINPGDYICVRGVDFGKGAQMFEATVRSITRTCGIEVRLDSENGKAIGICNVGSTGNPREWHTRSAALEPVKGVHDLYLVFTGVGKRPLFDFDSWRLR